MFSYFGVEAFSNGFPILGLGLFAASACPKWRIGSEAVFKKTSWSERYVEAGVQLTLRGVLGFVGESVTIRVSHDGVTVAVTTSMGRSFSQCVPLPLRHRPGHRSELEGRFELIHESVTFNQHNRHLELILRNSPNPGLSIPLSPTSGSEHRSSASGRMSSGRSHASSDGFLPL